MKNVFSYLRKLGKTGVDTCFIATFVLILCGCCLLFSCIKSKNIELNITYVENRRFQVLSEEDIRMITTFLKKNMLKFFDVSVKNIKIKKQSVEDYLQDEYKQKKENRPVVNSEIIKAVEDKLKFARIKRGWNNFFKNKTNDDIIQESIIKYIKIIKCLKLGRNNSHEYANCSLMNWNERLRKEAKYDLIIYNGVLIDDINYGVMHTIVRGFIAFGYSVKNNSKYKGTALVAVLPVMTDNLPFAQWRDGYLSHTDKCKAVSLIACHELGHILFDYDDEYAHDYCIMNPVKGYNFKDYLLSVKCSKKHSQRGYFREAVFRKKGVLIQSRNQSKQNEIRNNWNLGMSYIKSEKYKEAIEVFNSINYKRETVYFNLAYCYGRLNDFDKAIEFYKKALKEGFKPQYKIYLGIGLMFFRKKEYKTSIKYFLKSVEQNSQCAEAYYYLGELFSHEGDYDKAREYYEKTVELKEPKFSIKAQKKLEELGKEPHIEIIEVE